MHMTTKRLGYDFFLKHSYILEKILKYLFNADWDLFQIVSDRGGKMLGKVVTIKMKQD